VGINREVYMKSPQLLVLHIAHKDIEGIAMDREVMRLVNMLTSKFAELIYMVLV